jgi:GNAT superfamily N-acetyltransferase
MLIEMQDWDDAYLVLESSLPRERLISKLANTRAKGNSWFVWREGDAYLGWVIVHWNGKPSDPDYPDMMKLFVRPEHRRKGVAGRIIRACEQEARRRGFSRMGLSVHLEGNVPARLLYEGLGYTRTETPPYPFGKKGKLVVDMAREL